MQAHSPRRSPANCMSPSTVNGSRCGQTHAVTSLPSEQGGFSLRVDVDLTGDLGGIRASPRHEVTFANDNYPGRFGWRRSSSMRRGCRRVRHGRVCTSLTKGLTETPPNCPQADRSLSARCISRIAWVPCPRTRRGFHRVLARSRLREPRHPNRTGSGGKRAASSMQSPAADVSRTRDALGAARRDGARRAARLRARPWQDGGGRLSHRLARQCAACRITSGSPYAVARAMHGCLAQPSGIYPPTHIRKRLSA